MLFSTAKAQEFREDQKHATLDHHHVTVKVDTAVLTVNSNNLSGGMEIHFLSDYCHNVGIKLVIVALFLHLVLIVNCDLCSVKL